MKKNLKEQKNFAEKTHFLWFSPGLMNDISGTAELISDCFFIKCADLILNSQWPIRFSISLLVFHKTRKVDFGTWQPWNRPYCKILTLWKNECWIRKHWPKIVRKQLVLAVDLWIHLLMLFACKHSQLCQMSRKSRPFSSDDELTAL